MKEYDFYLFDFDGTLVSTERSIKKSVLYALDAFGIKEEDEKRLDYFIGPPLFDSFKTLYGVSDGTADALIAKYREKYGADGCLDADVYPGVSELLKTLRSRGKKIAVASSKPEPFIERISKHLGIYEYYDVISAISFSQKHSDKCELILKALSMLGCTDKSRAVMTGDRYLDIEGATAAGIDSAGAVFGFGSEEELATAGATYLLFNASELIY